MQLTPDHDNHLGFHRPGPHPDDLAPLRLQRQDPVLDPRFAHFDAIHFDVDPGFVDVDLVAGLAGCGGPHGPHHGRVAVLGVEDVGRHGGDGPGEVRGGGDEG